MDFNEKIKDRLEKDYKGKRKIRQDAIRHVDGIITSNDKFFENMSDSEIKVFFEHSLEFIKKEYGEENLLYATIHLDEKTPHMHFGLVPLTKDGRLSAKEVLGNKRKLSALQDKYNAFVNEKGYDMDRGETTIDTERKHKEMNVYKQETEYHKKELEEIQMKFNVELEKWDKIQRLFIQEEKQSIQPIVIAKEESPIPKIELKELPLTPLHTVEPEQVEKL
ncbi:MobV family relaxase [Massilibacterium senegalense]|uniref:MobV family relaxase n=1 Tax=Massilibacterium senegalense TaxID=1632858 RepID=UPI0009E817C8|nr:MobV family relaxase [Massilibacterium senegalense]